MQIFCYPNCDRAIFRAIGMGIRAISALIIALAFLFPGAGLRAAENPIKITADKLMEKYKNDEEAADREYKGNLLAITGIIIGVGKDSGGDAYVTLVTRDVILKVQCFFEKGNGADLTRLGSGEQVTVLGWCEGKSKESNVVVKKCSFKTHAKKKQEEVLGYYKLGNTYYGIGDYQQAIEDFGLALELDPRFAEAYWGRGRSYHELGNNRQAVEDLNQAIELEPKFPEAYWDRGKIYKELGNRQQAIDDWKTAAKFGHEGAQDFLKSQEIAW